MNFKTTSISFLISVCLVVLLNYFNQISLVWLLLPFVVYNALIIYGSASIQSDFFVKAICSAETNEKIIALTFDDGPHKEYTTQVLSALKEFEAKATFFVIGKNIRENEHIIRQIDAEGHTIGNHTYSHSFFIDFKSKKEFKEELNRTSDEVSKITRKRLSLFRPPYGVTTPNLASASKDLDYVIVGWNVRTMDTTNDTEEKIFERVQQQMKSGAIILFHDTSEKTVRVLKRTLQLAKENGYEIVGVDKIIELNTNKKL